MTKKLTEIIGELYTPKAPDEKKFVDKHVSKLFPNLYSRPEYDFLFKGTNVKTIDRSADRHGYNPGDDEKVYEEVEELDEAETKYVIKHKNTKQVLSTHDDYATAKDEHEGLGSEKKEYGVFKQTKKDADQRSARLRSMYREEVEELDEVLKVSDGAEAWIKDFVGSDNPKFEGKSKKERIDMALGAFYAAKRKNK